MKCLSKLLKYIDQFGSSVQLNYKKSYTLKTHFGGLFTIIAFSVFIAITVIFGREIVIKEKPTIVFSKIKRNMSEIYLKEFPIALGFKNKNGVDLLDVDKILTYYAVQYVFRLNETHPLIVEVNNNLTFHQCDLPDFNYYNETAGISIPNYKSSKCLSYSNYTRFYNDYGTMNSSFISIRIEACNNNTRKEGNKCLPAEIIKSRLTEFYVLFSHPSYYIEPLKSVPGSLSNNIITQRVGFNFFKRNFLRITRSEIITNTGWIGDDYSGKSYYELKDLQYDIDIGAEEPDLKYVITLESPRIGDQYVIRYVKLQEIVANIGGIMSVIIFLCTIACEKVAEISLILQQSKDLVNFHSTNEPDCDLFNDEDDKKAKKSGEKPFELVMIPFEKNNDNNENNKRPSHGYSTSKSKIKSQHKLLSQSKQIQVNSEAANIIANNEDNLESNRDLEQKEKGIAESSDKTEYLLLNKSKIGFCHYLKILICQGKKSVYKKRVYNLVIDYFRNKLDICTYIKLQHDFNLLKFLFLGTKNEREELFNLKISIDDIMDFDKEKKEAKKVVIEKKDEEEIEIKEQERQRKIRRSITFIKENLSSKKLFNVTE